MLRHIVKTRRPSMQDRADYMDIWVADHGEISVKYAQHSKDPDVPDWVKTGEIQGSFSQRIIEEYLSHDDLLEAWDKFRTE